MERCGLMLDHPAPPFDFAQVMSSNTPYFNPHNPPPGGHNRHIIRPNGGMFQGPPPQRWATQQVGKSVEVQRSQVDELFKTLKTGGELRETEAGT